MDITPLRIHSSSMNCFNKVVLIRFYNELKFHILLRDGTILGLPTGIKLSISSKSGHNTFLLSAVDVVNARLVFWATSIDAKSCLCRL